MLADAPEKLAQFQKMGLLQAPILEAEDGSLSSGFDVDFLGKFV